MDIIIPVIGPGEYDLPVPEISQDQYPELGQEHDFSFKNSQNNLIFNASIPLSKFSDFSQLKFKNDSQLSQVICPVEIINEFKRSSLSNTSNKVVTMAILAGSIIDDSYIVNTLIIPC